MSLAPLIPKSYDSHIVGGASEFVSLTADLGTARDYSRSGTDAGYVVIAVDPTKLPDLVYLPTAENIQDKAMRDLAEQDREYVTTKIPKNAIVGEENTSEDESNTDFSIDGNRITGDRAKGSRLSCDDKGRSC